MSRNSSTSKSLNDFRFIRLTRQGTAAVGESNHKGGVLSSRVLAQSPIGISLSGLGIKKKNLRGFRREVVKLKFSVCLRRFFKRHGLGRSFALQRRNELFHRG